MSPLLALTALVGCATPRLPLSAPPAPPVVVVPVPTVTDLSPLAVEIEAYVVEVWGGDGDGFEAVWSQELTVIARNPRAESVVVEGIAWTVGGELREALALEREVAGGGEERLILNAHLGLEGLRFIRGLGDTAELAIELRWRDLDGSQVTELQQTVTTGYW